MRTVFLLVAALTFFPCSLAQARQPTLPVASQKTSVVVSARDASDFTRCFTSISKQASLTIVVEGQPVYPELDSSQLTQYTEKPLPFRDAIETFAALFDYRVAWKNQTVLLKKRYTSPVDVPGVTVEECRDALHDVNGILNRYEPDLKSEQFDNKRAPMATFARSLSAQQLQKMGEKTLRASDLNPEQRAFFKRFCLYAFAKVRGDRMQTLEENLKRTSSSEAMLRWDVTVADGALVVEAPSAISYVSPVIPLPHETRNVSERLRGFLTSKPQVSSTARSATTLNDIAALLNRVAGRKPVVTVDDSLKGKPITVFGMQYAQPREVLYSIAGVYGLRVFASEKEAHLMRPSRMKISRLEDVALAIRQALPEPFARIILYDLSQTKMSPSLQYTAGGNTTLFSQQMKQGREAYELKTSRPLLLAATAYQALESSRSAAQKAKSGKTPVQSLSPRQNGWIANILLWKEVGDLWNLVEIPKYLTDFDNTLVVGGFSESKGKHYFGLGIATLLTGSFRGKIRTNTHAYSFGVFNP